MDNFIRIPDDTFRLHCRIESMIDRGVRHLGPTISPAPKNVDKKEIESLEEAVKYWFNVKNVDSIVIQPKYMGSYCDVYLHRNIEKTYLISKNGYNVRNLSQEQIVSLVKNIHEKLFNGDENVEQIILQSELLPWSVLGKGLIDYGYKSYIDVKTEYYNRLNYFKDKVAKIKQSESYINADLTKAHLKRQYKAIDSLSNLLNTSDDMLKGVEIMKGQLEIHGNDNEPYLKPFNILVKIYNDGNVELVNDNINSFKQLSDDDYLIIDTSSDLETAISNAYEFYNKLVSDGTIEGVVVKPSKAFIDNQPLGLKVRNHKFLHLIYGEDFDVNNDIYVVGRNIKKKLESSISDWQISKEMLKEIPSQDNYRLKNLILQRVNLEKIESTIDNRL